MIRGRLLVCNSDDMMATSARGVTATQDELRAAATARRKQKRKARKEAKREAERSNSGTSPCRVLTCLALVIKLSLVALLGVGTDASSAGNAASQLTQTASYTSDGAKQTPSANNGDHISPRHFDYHLGREISQAEWAAAAAKLSRGSIRASKKEMEEWAGPSASVRRRRGFPRDTDLDTIRRYEHTDLKSALEEVERVGEGDGGRTGDVDMAGTVGSSF